MCGIGFSVCSCSASCSESPAYQNSQSLFAGSKRFINRGPDVHNEIIVRVSSEWHIHLAGAVLNLRGKKKSDVTSQPLTDTKGNILLLNGQIYSFGKYGNRLFVEYGLNDAKVLLDILQTKETIEDISEVLSSLLGPWSIIYWSKRNKTLIFGRDRIGRRSLLLSQGTINQGPITGVSVAVGKLSQFKVANGSSSFQRVEAGFGIHKICFGDNGPLDTSLIRWTSGIAIQKQQCERLDRLVSENYFEASFPEHVQKALNKFQIPNTKENALYHSALKLMYVLDEAVRTRLTYIPEYQFTNEEKPGARVGILFSGGLDCTVLAALAHRHLPINEPIDLLNVCFAENHKSPDRLQAIDCAKELRSTYPDRTWNLVQINASFQDVLENEERILTLCFPNVSHMDFNIGASLWFASKGVGFLQENENSDNDPVIDDNLSDHFERLFAFCEDECKPRTEATIECNNKGEKGKSLPKAKIPRLTCTFDKMCTKVAKSACNIKACKSCCRQNQKSTRRKCKAHKLNQHEMKHYKVVYDAEPIEEEKKPEPTPRISKLVYYESRAQVLLNGLGADEQLGGYGRHRGAFLYKGWGGLKKEIEMDTGRIWSRNLGRDDRCISDHGKEVRHPYLDEYVMQVLRDDIPIQHIVNYKESRAVGDKRILRIVSHLLGMTKAATYEKRAIQFGTRLAKLSNIRSFGSNRAFSGEAEYTVST